MRRVPRSTGGGRREGVGFVRRAFPTVTLPEAARMGR
jgi:hypothetical protein